MKESPELFYWLVRLWVDEDYGLEVLRLTKKEIAEYCKRTKPRQFIVLSDRGVLLKDVSERHIRWERDAWREWG